ncbi:MAG TPA: betaine-aldehyde dehydrogenase [Aromatoleum sp.]|uniref:betaine-aldehyde dehydrogenase n=1 Tax=Aromatoleum sp. TaxID=2307007 RepID=UPI002B480DD0|nr:betaine-aldehyde dehydrogenase [Aromatoleum sp.]HJV27422.1 betaine-aldehyde dehydrogenase [Aromatoleum sp.]
MTTPTSIQQSYVGGRNLPNASGETFDDINPATGELLCRVEQAGTPEVERAVLSASEGFAQWSAMTGAERGRILNRAARILRERNRELAELEVLDTGKPVQEAEAVDILSGADCIEYYAGLAASLHGEHFQLKGAFAYTRREPLGICVGIGAWNYPIQIACWKSAPALACGNAMIFKPAELTPLTTAKLAEIYTEAGLPPGVFNVLQGDARTGQMLVRHPDVAKVSLTGEIGTGKRVMADAAATLKHVTMELGGKSPLIVFADADLRNAVSAAMLANFYTQGEICSNGTRVFVHEAIYDAFLEQLAERTRAMKIGDPRDPQTQVGALISEAHMNRVLEYIESGKRSARLVSGGGRAHVDGLPGGFFVKPTIFADCTDDCEIVREEIFGPVMSVLKFSDEEDVIRRANATPFGLAGGVFTRDLARAHRVVAQLQAGICWINNYNITPVEIPFGGVKQSGIGRENGLAALEHYTQLKSVYVEMGDVACPY